MKTTIMKTTKVVILQRILPHYRIGFFSNLYKMLRTDNIELQLLYGQEFPGSVPRTTDIDSPWGRRVNNIYIHPYKKTELIWQQTQLNLKDVDLLIVEQANRLLLNYPLLLSKKLFGYKIAFWGHGRDYQNQNPSIFSRAFKAWYSSKADWWFAYTSKSLDDILGYGVKRQKITVVQNSIDTLEFRETLTKVTNDEIGALRASLNIKSNNVCLYCGGLYKEKKIHFLINSCYAIRSKIPDFEIVIVGGGPDQHLVESFSRNNSWVHYVGEKFGSDRSVYYRLSKALLMPGLVGLVLVDSFIAETPIVTTNIPIHSPEIAYLQNGHNGIITKHSIESYSTEVANLISSPALQLELKKGCHISAKYYTIDRMVSNFATGIRNCLGG